MDNEAVEKLIEIVKGHVFLYDIGHQDYKNAHLKWKMWESIGMEFNQSGEVVKNKWKTVRDGYTKYKKLRKSAKGSKKKIVTYTWASQLKFLDNYSGPRSSSNVQDDSGSSQHVPSPLPWTSQLLSQEWTPNTSTTLTSLKRPSEIKREDAKKKRRLDVIDNLFLSYADTFKRFPAREQAIAKLELAKLFSNIELQLIDNNAYETNYNYYASVASPASSTSSVENQTRSSQNQSINQEVKVEADYLN